MPTRRDVFNRLNAAHKLPTPSNTTMEVIRLCKSDSTSLNDIAGVIQTDPALSAELLKYANAAFLSTGIQVASIQKATVKLGMKTVVNLALGFSLLATNKKGKCRTFDYEQFWSTSLLQAIAAKTIVATSREFDPEELFICGLLSHMGQLALASLFPEEYEEILARLSLATKDELSLSTDLRKSLEKDVFQIDSAELTTELFLDWGLPAHYALGAGFHDDLNNIELGAGKTYKVAEILNIAHNIAAICQDPQPSRDQLITIEQAAQAVGIEQPHFGSIYDAIIAQWYDWGEVFKIKTSPCPLYSAIIGS